MLFGSPTLAVLGKRTRDDSGSAAAQYPVSDGSKHLRTEGGSLRRKIYVPVEEHPGVNWNGK